MFERYTEKARRTIFVARREASTYGSPTIETEHLLLGILHEDKGLASRLSLTAQAIHNEISERTPPPTEPTPTSVDLPLSHESKRILAYGAEESQALASRIIDVEHLILGLLREPDSFAARLLRQHGIGYDAYRKNLIDSAIKEHKQRLAWRGVTTDAANLRSREQMETREPSAPALQAPIAKLENLFELRDQTRCLLGARRHASSETETLAAERSAGQFGRLGHGASGMARPRVDRAKTQRAGLCGRAVGIRPTIQRVAVAGHRRPVGLCEPPIDSCPPAYPGGKIEHAMPHRHRGPNPLIDADRPVRRALRGCFGTDFGAPLNALAHRNCLSAYRLGHWRWRRSLFQQTGAESHQAHQPIQHLLHANLQCPGCRLFSHMHDFTQQQRILMFHADRSAGGNAFASENA